jgi:hypothetical protein
VSSESNVEVSFKLISFRIHSKPGILALVILASQEAEIRRIVVPSQLRQIVLEKLS